MLLAWMPLIAVLTSSAPGAGGTTLRPIERKVVAPSPPLRLAGSARPAPAEGAETPPPCVGDVCQPRVSVPGYEPRVSIRGKRTELAARLLDRANLEPFATVAHFLVITGLRFDLTPAALETGPSRGGEGWGHAQLSLRWRIDASGRPVWAAAR